ncbi:hypothetical protein J6590_083835, partial [Homalodisca vitripennis]
MPVFSKTAILTSQVFGGFFLTYSSVPNEGQELRFSLSWFTWSLISTVAQATLPYYWMYLFYFNTLATLPSYWTTNTTTAVMILEFSGLSLTSVVVFVSNIRKYQCFVNFHKTVESVEDTWSDISHQPPESRINISIRVEQELARQCFGRLMENQHMLYIEISQESSNSQKCEVRTLLNIYWLLVDAVHQANAFYCDQLMATISYLIFSIVFNLYYAVLTYESGDYIKFIFPFIWALASISYMMVMVRSADDIMITICKKIREDIDPAMRTQLERFLLQVTTDTPTFSGLHLFKIKNDTLTKIAGAVTTYL